MSTDTPRKQRGKYRTVAPVLTVQDVRFCQALIMGDSRHDAYVKAGYPACPNRVATDAAAYRRVKNRQIIKYLRHLQDVAAEAAKVTVEEFAAGVSRIANADLRKLFDTDGVILPVHEWPDDIGMVVEAIENGDEGFPKKVKLGSVKLAAWRTLAEWKRAIGGSADIDPTAKLAPLVIVSGPTVIAPPPDEPEESNG